MNVQELYKVQQGLKDHIGYKGKDKFSKMMLAMQVEFMECANDWRGFKYWSEDQQPKKSLLEEYVDGLHFVLETGLDLVELGYIHALPKMVEPYKRSGATIERLFQQLLYLTLNIQRYMNDFQMNGVVHREYMLLFSEFLNLGRLLGFNEESIHKAYMEKNAENHNRQERGY
ncbi:dimeric dUTPase [Bacillus phage vB_BcM_Sam46]|uniref:Dimeric dUTPase n=2 Tax=Caudoviricetes TaxID=2731619 RepID=A0A6G9L6T2_9CAUD|nr:dimeric dUTPase [Bacillus phage vB_BcM_Sam112]QIQ61273.1 dimeric dUTPase [Bacillus phage vB_BcM_Sam46]